MIDFTPGIYTDISASDYQKIDAIRWSDLSAAVHSGLALHHQLTTPRTDRAVFRFGRALHCYALTPDLFKDEVWIAPSDVITASGEIAAGVVAMAILKPDEFARRAVTVPGEHVTPSGRMSTGKAAKAWLGQQAKDAALVMPNDLERIAKLRHEIEDKDDDFTPISAGSLDKIDDMMRAIEGHPFAEDALADSVGPRSPQDEWTEALAIQLICAQVGG